MKTMKSTLIPLIAIFLLSALSGCGKLSDTLNTVVDGYAVRCIEGTKFVLLSSERGLAITPLVGVDGRPKGCDQ